MTNVIETLKEGDIYRWSYRGPDVDMRQYGSYHCCSCIGIVHRDRLRDTYWMIGSSFSECRSFGVDDLPNIRLTFLANLADLEKAPEYHADYYDDADIVNLNHPNSPKGNFFLRKGAVRNQKKMLEVAREYLERSKANERSAVRRSEELCEIISRIESGDTSGHIPSVPRGY